MIPIHLLSRPLSQYLLTFFMLLFLAKVFNSRSILNHRMEFTFAVLFLGAVCRSVSEPSSYLTVSYPKDQLCFLARGEGRAWSDCLCWSLFPGDGFMLKLIRNGIMKRFVLLMAAFVSGRPATYDGLPLSPCSLPMWPVFSRPLLDGFFPLTPYFPPSCHLCSQAFSSLIASILSFPLLPHLNFYLPAKFHQVFPFVIKDS